MLLDLVAAALALVIAIAGVVVVEPRRRRRRYEAMLEHTAQLEVELGIRPAPPGYDRSPRAAAKRWDQGAQAASDPWGQDAYPLALPARLLEKEKRSAELEQAAKWRREALRQAQADMREAQKPRRRESL